MQSLESEQLSTDVLVRRCRTMNVEIFHINEQQCDREIDPFSVGWSGPGWYWWSCSPGCIPDGEAYGPFNTKRECAIDGMGDQS